MTRALRVLVYGAIVVSGVVLLLNTEHPLLVQAAVLVALALIGTLGLYESRSEATKYVPLAVAVLLMGAAATAAGGSLAGLVVLVLAVLAAVLLGRRRANGPEDQLQSKRR